MEVEQSAKGADDDVAVDVNLGRIVVQVDAPTVVRCNPGTRVVIPFAEPEDVVDVVVADDRTAGRNPVSPAAVRRAGVARLQVDVADVVEFDDLVVPAVDEREPGTVVDEIPRGAVSHAGEDHADPLLIEDAGVVDVVIFGGVARRSERFTVATGEVNAAGPDVGNVIPQRRAVAALEDGDTGGADSPNRTSDDAAVFALAEEDAVTATAFDGQPFESQVRGALGKDDLFCRRNDDLAGESLRWVEIEGIVLFVVEPFAGGVQFLEDVIDVIAVAGPDRVGGVAGQFDGAGREVKRPDRQAVIPPVVPGEHEDARLGRPRPVSAVRRFDREIPLALAGDALVHRNRLAVDVGPAPGVGVRGIEIGVPRRDLPFPAGENLIKRRPGEPLRRQVGFQNLPFIWHESANRLPPDKGGFFPVTRPINDRRVGRTRVGLGERETLRQIIDTAIEKHGKRSGFSGPLSSPDFIAGLCEGLQRAVRFVGLRLGHGAGMRIVSFRRDVKNCVAEGYAR